MVSDQNEVRDLVLDVAVPEPFEQGQIIIRQGEWIQCEVRAKGEPRILNQERGWRIYFDGKDFPSALFQLLSAAFEHPAGLPMWERGTRIPGYREEPCPTK